MDDAMSINLFAIRCTNVTKRFGSVLAVNQVELAVAPGEFLGLLGPSGCGKTTFLRLIAGFEVPDTGTIEIGDVCVVGPKTWVLPERRRVGMVFQDYALFPHMTVAENVAYGVRKWPDQRERVGNALRLVGLDSLRERIPSELSGGQQQRVALARALAPEPDVILMDEPFSNLDVALRARIRDETRDILARAGATVIFVTHDQEEALSLADRVAVMWDGQIAQVGEPEELYCKPVSREVADFVGSANFLYASVADGHAQCALGRFAINGEAHSGELDLMFRPEDITLTVSPDGSSRVMDATFYGHDSTVTVRLETGEHVQVRLLGAPLAPGTRVHCNVTKEPRTFLRQPQPLRI
jgi:iron(III) transport system ATP-binding protein